MAVERFEGDVAPMSRAVAKLDKLAMMETLASSIEIFLDTEVIDDQHSLEKSIADDLGTSMRLLRQRARSLREEMMDPMTTATSNPTRETRLDDLYRGLDTRAEAPMSAHKSKAHQLKRIDRIERAPSSYYGNPAYWITFTDGTQARTMTDASCAYAVGNPGMRENCDVVVEFTRAGRIRHMGPQS